MVKRAMAAAVAAAALLAPGPPAAGPWHLAWSTRFATPAALGRFSGCTRKPVCTGLPEPIRSEWWAYPGPWPDTATERGYPHGGYYCPARTVWIAGGRMHIRLFRPGAGPDCSAAVVPRAALGRVYGRYVITFRVTGWSPSAPRGRGYKTAVLLDPSGPGADEIDWPENEWDRPLSAYVHGLAELGYDTSARWETWHTTALEWTPAGLVFRLDGRVIGRPRVSPRGRMDWIIQNESALDGEQAAPGSWAELELGYAEYDAWEGG